MPGLDDDLAIDRALARLLGGGEARFAGNFDANVAAIMRRIEFHGIGGLLGHFALDRLPHNLGNEIRQTSISQAFWEAQHVRRLGPLLEALEQCGARPLIFKGTALAYTVYDAPYTRSRGDSDVLVRESAFEQACNVIRSFGYRAPVTGLSVEALGARSFSIGDEQGFTHEIDLHQRINGSRIIARTFTHDELHGRSEPILEIGVGARAIGSADALLVACFHRLIHRQSPYYVDGRAYLSSDRLIWLHDIKLLHQAMTRPERQILAQSAQEKGLSAVLADGLAATDQWLDLGEGDLDREPRAPGAAELPYRYLTSGSVQRWMLDLAVTERKGRALKDLLIPSRDYMEAKYGAGLLKVPGLAYIWRALHGLYKAARR